MIRTYIAAAAVVATGLAGLTWYLTQSSNDNFDACRIGSIGTGSNSIGGPFQLVDENGKDVTDKDVITKPTLLYFGYTFCPDVCPLDNARTAEALDLIQARGIDAQMAFVSIDPERDTPEQLKDFTDYLHDDMIGLTGTAEQIKAASQAYKTYYKKQEPEEGMEDYYLVDHSTFTYLVLPKAGFVDFFRRNETAQSMADRVACFIDAGAE